MLAEVRRAREARPSGRRDPTEFRSRRRRSGWPNLVVGITRQSPRRNRLLFLGCQGLPFKKQCVVRWQSRSYCIDQDFGNKLLDRLCRLLNCSNLVGLQPVERFGVPAIFPD